MSGQEKPKFGSHLTHEDRVRNGRIGGLKNGENARKRREMKAAIEILMDMPLEKKSIKELETVLSFKDLKGKNLTINDAIIVKQVQKALNGDLQAVIFLRDTSGQKPKDDITINGNINNPFAELSTEELKKLVDND